MYLSFDLHFFFKIISHLLLSLFYWALRGYKSRMDSSSFLFVFVSLWGLFYLSFGCFRQIYFVVKAACLVASKVGVLKEADSGAVLRLSVTALETVTGFTPRAKLLFLRGLCQCIFQWGRYHRCCVGWNMMEYWTGFKGWQFSLLLGT